LTTLLPGHQFYKRLIGHQVFNQLKYPLVVVGDGPEYSKLKRGAGRNIRFVGRISDAELSRSLSQCRALVFPGEEDFGMVVVEAHACGRQVIALARGGALETVVPDLNGLLFAEEMQSFTHVGTVCSPRISVSTTAHPGNSHPI
jgi:glycosyltransferase involved in cell wall biosynthesis